MCGWSDDSEGVWFEPRDRRAAKSHPCGECGRTIRPGETYRRYAGRQEGEFWSALVCLQCGAAGEWVSRRCGYLMVGVLLDNVDEHSRADHEPDARVRCEFRRLERGMRAKWATRLGEGRMRPPGPPPEWMKKLEDEIHA